MIDVSGYVPRHVDEASRAVGDVGRYLFVSTGSVYDRERAPGSRGDLGGMDEDAPRLAPERATEQVDGDTYGPLKVACEDDVRAHHGERATLVRPGIVAGPHDPTDRFTWWVRRAARGGEVALPGRPDQPVQVVDSRDLAALVLTLVHADRSGVFNAVGPQPAVTLRQLVHLCARAAGTTVQVAPVDPSAVEPGFPLVLPGPSYDVLHRRSAERAHQAGMPSTPLVETAADVLAWDRERGTSPLEIELTLEREAELLSRHRV